MAAAEPKQQPKRTEDETMKNALILDHSAGAD